MPDTRSNGLRIHYEDSGQGEPALLFMPGWCASHAAFGKLPAQSAAFRRTLAIDWRGHGQSEAPTADFGDEGLLEDALSVIEASGVRQIVPVALAHAGWVAMELRRRLGERVSKLVLVEWLVLEAPAPFRAALKSLQLPDEWRQARDQLFSMWLVGMDNRALINFVRGDMGSHGPDMWARAGREISKAYARTHSPLKALARLQPHLPVLHLYGQPDDPGYLRAQQSFAVANPWFGVRRLHARSHFPMFELPGDMAEAIEEFVAGAQPLPEASPAWQAQT